MLTHTGLSTSVDNRSSGSVPITKRLRGRVNRAGGRDVAVTKTGAGEILGLLAGYGVVVLVALMARLPA
jgi:hypothetical protein